MNSFNETLLSHWRNFCQNLSSKHTILDGHSLSLATVIAVARQVGVKIDLYPRF